MPLTAVHVTKLKVHNVHIYVNEITIPNSAMKGTPLEKGRFYKISSHHKETEKKRKRIFFRV